MRTDDARAFVPEPGTKTKHERDALSEMLGAEFVASATSGEESTENDINQELTEETGGPFVESPASREFAQGTDLSNPIDAEPAEFPTANAVPKR